MKRGDLRIEDKDYRGLAVYAAMQAKRLTDDNGSLLNGWDQGGQRWQRPDQVNRFLGDCDDDNNYSALD